MRVCCVDASAGQGFPRARRFASYALLIAIVCTAGCAHPKAPELRTYIEQDGAYLALPNGPERADALWTRAVELGGDAATGLEILGTLSVAEGVVLQHPFNTGLTADGVLSCPDKTGHFFAYAMWRYKDHFHLIHTAGTLGVFWEVCGEVKRWVSGGDGFDMEDIWANRLGSAFAKELYRRLQAGEPPPLPSEIIAQADDFRPTSIPPDAPADCDP